MNKRENEWSLIRFIDPAFPEVNIFTKPAKETTALGPVMVATVANKLEGWQAEIIDENNHYGPRDSQGLPDHRKLQSVKDIPGISFWEDGEVKTNSPEMLVVPNLNNLPYPDFGLVRFAEIKFYPVGRIRGCGMNCEFCSVRGKPRWAAGQHLFETIKWLVETRKARYFFIVDDRLEEDLAGTLDCFKLVAAKYGNHLRFTVQTRLETAKNANFLEAMRTAGVNIVCIGYESPIDEELRAMRKGYSSL